MARYGALLILGATVFWLGALLVPFLDLDAGTTAALVVGLVITREVVFWIGVLLLGRETWRVTKELGWRRAPRALWTLVVHPRRPRPATEPAAGSD
ncbi:MAG TPA: transporter suffix domain-containing protein [Pseudonocardiaceae bacterium]